MDNVEKNAAIRLAPRHSDLVWNVMTVLVLVVTFIVAGIFLYLYFNPNSMLNPFRPGVVPATIAAPTATATEAFPPTWTPTATPLATATFTPEPPTATATRPVSIIPSSTPGEEAVGTPSASIEPTNTGDASASYSFGSRNPPAEVPSSIVHADKGCKWAGVGGQVYDLQGTPYVGATIHLGGEWGGKEVDMLSMSGTAVQYGPAGFEFTLGDQPQASQGSLWVQMVDQAGLLLSDKVYFDTFTDCQKNLVLINFRQVR